MLCRGMIIRAQEHEVPDEGKLSLNWNPEMRPKMRVVHLDISQRRDCRQPPEWQRKISRRRNSGAVSRARICEHEI